MGKYSLVTREGDSLNLLGEVEADYLPGEKKTLTFNGKSYLVVDIQHDIVKKRSKLEGNVKVRVILNS